MTGIDRLKQRKKKWQYTYLTDYNSISEYNVVIPTTGYDRRGF